MKRPSRQIPDRCCINCHFCMKYVSGFIRGEPNSPLRGELECHERDTLRKRFATDGSDWIMGDGFACHHGVYDIHDPMAAAAWHEILPLDRGDTCFFYLFVEGMSQEATVVLEKRTVDRREAEKDRHLTRETANAARRTAKAAIIVACISAAISLGVFLWSRLSPQPVQVHVKSLPAVPPSTQPSPPTHAPTP